MEKLKKILLSTLTFMCMIILILDILIFTLKKTSEQYLKEDKINNMINNINVVDLFKDKNGKELEEFTEIKNKFVESGIPNEAIDEFINSKPINDYASDTINKSINNILENKNEKIISSNDLNQFLEENINDISKELQDNNVENSEYLTKENQEKFLNKIKEKTPYIEAKIEEISNKINEKLGLNYNLKIKKTIKILKLLYTKLLDLILIIIFIIFIIGIFITRQSIYKSFKWIGITFIISSLNIYLINFLIIKIYKHLNNEGYTNIIKNILEDFNNKINNYSLIYLIIGITFIILNIIIYIIKEKQENKKLKNID